MINMKNISDLLLGLSYYQAYDINYNGEIEPKTIDELVERIEVYATEDELAELDRLAYERRTAEFMEKLTYGHFDFNFNLT